VLAPARLALIAAVAFVPAASTGWKDFALSGSNSIPLSSSHHEGWEAMVPELCGGSCVNPEWHLKHSWYSYAAEVPPVREPELVIVVGPWTSAYVGLAPAWLVTTTLEEPAIADDALQPLALSFGLAAPASCESWQSEHVEWRLRTPPNSSIASLTWPALDVMGCEYQEAVDASLAGMPCNSAAVVKVEPVPAASWQVKHMLLSDGGVRTR